MVIKSVTENDVCFLASAKDFGFTDAWSKEMLISAFNTGRFYGFVAYENSNPVGFITYSVLEDFSDIEDVFVLPNFRNKGVANALLTAVIDRLKELNVPKILLEVRESNLIAISLYKKFGFNEISVRKKYYSNGENAVIYEKRLLL